MLPPSDAKPLETCMGPCHVNEATTAPWRTFSLCSILATFLFCNKKVELPILFILLLQAVRWGYLWWRSKVPGVQKSAKQKWWNNAAQVRPVSSSMSPLGLSHSGWISMPTSPDLFTEMKPKWFFSQGEICLLQGFLQLGETSWKFTKANHFSMMGKSFLGLQHIQKFPRYEDDVPFPKIGY